MKLSDILAEDNISAPTEASRRSWALQSLRRRFPEGLGAASLRHVGRRPRRAKWYPLVRRRLIERDGWCCSLCGLEPSASEKAEWHSEERWPSWLHIDHKVPLAHDGDHHFDNLRLLCSGCNSAEWSAAKEANAGPSKLAWWESDW